ncbi:hypothetical protein HYPSUDRAFT_198750 [Hypholoma sublateritium FD-334 SS-4]|uniref:Uncharacterized protein n=1 Tax=Hypholoma sublateritium (strain FD-334 SS-4) TaxID=945553 RepID=A0A0D2PCY3_HYPSF|nr:hypothetical protein HYPSUDRAFT_198750 [Hypholoma sublateritium FD-334 SS-4]
MFHPRVLRPIGRSAVASRSPSQSPSSITACSYQSHTITITAAPHTHSWRSASPLPAALVTTGMLHAYARRPLHAFPALPRPASLSPPAHPLAINAHHGRCSRNMDNLRPSTHVPSTQRDSARPLPHLLLQPPPVQPAYVHEALAYGPQ